MWVTKHQSECPGGARWPVPLGSPVLLCPAPVDKLWGSSPHCQRVCISTVGDGMERGGCGQETVLSRLAVCQEFLP